MPLPTLSDYRARTDPAPSWRWQVSLPAQLPAPGSGMLPGPYNVRSLGRQLYVEAASLPSPAIEALPVFRLSTREYFSGFLDHEPVQITFNEDADYTVFKYLWTWRNLVVDENRNWGMPNNYKLPIQYELYGWKNTSPTLSVRLMGCWPTQVPAIDLSYAQSDYIRTTCAFSIDSVDPFPAGSNPGGTITYGSEISQAGLFQDDRDPSIVQDIKNNSGSWINGAIDYMNNGTNNENQ